MSASPDMISISQNKIEEIVFDLATIKNEILHLSRSVATLSKILIEDNERSLAARVAVSETRIHSIEQKLSRMEAISGGIKIALISSTIGVIASISVAIIEFWNHIK